MDNNLGNVIKNSTARAYIYGGYVIAGVLIGLAQAVIPDPDPEWLQYAFNGWAYLAIPVGTLAAANSNIVPTKFVTTDKVETVVSENTTVEGDNL
jgi:hypothetical protein